jgi:ribosomal protein S18 acetylase RimI-like enzyme
MIKAIYSDKQFIIDILSRAFENNNCVNEVIKQGRNRQKRIRNIMDYSFEICWNYGEIYYTPDHKAVALLFFPEKKKSTVKSILRDVSFLLSDIDARQIIKVITREFQLRKYYPEHFAYLWYLGVDPECQGKGVGSSLLKEVIKLEDRSNVPIYLETSTLINLSFYKRLHFKVFKRLHYGYTLFMLKREPQRADSTYAAVDHRFRNGTKLIYHKTA